MDDITKIFVFCYAVIVLFLFFLLEKNKKEFLEEILRRIGTLWLELSIFNIVISIGFGSLMKISVESRYQLVWIFNEYILFFLYFLAFNFLIFQENTIRHQIKKFIEAAIKTIENHFLFHLLFLLLAIFFYTVYKDLFIALVASYIFYFLTEMTREYEKNRGKESNKLFLGQIVINLIYLIILAAVFQMKRFSLVKISLSFGFFVCALLIFYFVVSHCNKKIDRGKHLK